MTDAPKLSDEEFPLHQPRCLVDGAHRVAGRGSAWGAVEWHCLDCSSAERIHAQALQQMADQLRAHQAAQNQPSIPAWTLPHGIGSVMPRDFPMAKVGEGMREIFAPLWAVLRDDKRAP